MTKITNVVFDIGNVLVDWQPVAAWIDDLGSEDAVHEFMARVDFPARNLRGDHGETFADMARELPDAQDRMLLKTYPERFARTVTQGIAGTWALVDRLEAAGVALHAITNWSSETWPMGVQAHPRLGTMFGTTIVSGAVGLIKPDPAIYRLFCETSGVAAQTCVFVDDRAENIAGAKSIGMDGIHFTSPEALEAGLIARGLL